MRTFLGALACSLVVISLAEAAPLETGTSLSIDASAGALEYEVILKDRRRRSEIRAYQGAIAHLHDNGFAVEGGAGYLRRRTSYVVESSSVDLLDLPIPPASTGPDYGSLFARFGYQGEFASGLLGAHFSRGTTHWPTTLPSISAYLGKKRLYFYSDFAATPKSLESGIFRVGLGSIGERVKGSLGVDAVPYLSADGSLSFRLRKPVWLNLGALISLNGRTGPQGLGTVGFAYAFGTEKMNSATTSSDIQVVPLDQ